MMKMHQWWDALKEATHQVGPGMKPNNMPLGAAGRARRNLAEQARWHGHSRGGLGGKALTPHRKAF